ncbi:mRNA-capping enzyme subunit alpha-like [Rutidosis leptorrhynchoides]|uniref:mRNA-capping enzyme subunit alpha-like n=1 Tax=Rutidosis leptorrhynchoides TaxID=125765 RepID=UPI003A98EC96
MTWNLSGYVRRKDFWLLSTVNKLLKEFIPKLSHEADGLIFQGWDDPYVPRTHQGLLKWKYASMNSVDFLFEIDANGRHLLYLYERGKKKLMDGDRVVFKDEEDPSVYSEKIIECAWNKEEEIWKYMRIRPDKNTPNDINTFRKVMRSIRDNITEEVLLNEINEIIRLPMYADRIRSDSKMLVRRRYGTLARDHTDRRIGAWSGRFGRQDSALQAEAIAILKSIDMAIDLNLRRYHIGRGLSKLYQRVELFTAEF